MVQERNGGGLRPGLKVWRLIFFRVAKGEEEIGMRVQAWNAEEVARTGTETIRRGSFLKWKQEVQLQTCFL